MLPVNPEAIGLFGLFATVICFGLEQVGVGVKGADHAKLTRSLGYIAVFFGGFTQLFTGVCMYLFSVGGDHSIYLGTVFSFFGLFWILVGFFFLKGGDKKVMALIPAWYTEKPALTKLAGVCNLAIGIISLFLLFPALFA